MPADGDQESGVGPWVRACGPCRPDFRPSEGGIRKGLEVRIPVVKGDHECHGAESWIGGVLGKGLIGKEQRTDIYRRVS